ncbi:MAG TPA: alpha/beta fold hydrolase [Planctomycetota bacterium]|nr:alpha/beta fold hydrolase [Planctomycetota bacterium]
MNCSRPMLVLLFAAPCLFAQSAALQLERYEAETADGTRVPSARGWLTVPENRRKPDGRKLELAVLKLDSTAKDPGPPILYLHGGPGGSASGEMRDPAFLPFWSRFRELGDVILFDQRGCGRSKPPLARALQTPPDATLFTTSAAMGKAIAAGSRELHGKLTAEGIDLTAYTTEENADDVDALREALGAEKMRLLGFSYGTHLGLSVIRRHGRRVDAAVLVGVEGPDHTWKLPSNWDTHFRKLALLVARDPRIGAQVPDLTALLHHVLEQLGKQPIEVAVRGPGGAGQVTVPVGADGLLFLLRMDLGDTSDLVVFPRLLHTIKKGDGSVLRWFVQKRYGQFSGLNALWFTTDPASGASPERAARIAREASTALFRNAMNFDFPDVDAVWKMPVLGEHFRAPIVTDVRTLFLTGTLDANTPPWQAEEVRWGFARSTHLISEHAGHEDWMRNPKVLPVLLRFFAGEDVHAADVDMPPVKFMLLEGKDDGVSHPSVQ